MPAEPGPRGEPLALFGGDLPDVAGGILEAAFDVDRELEASGIEGETHRKKFAKSAHEGMDSVVGVR